MPCANKQSTNYIAAINLEPNSSANIYFNEYEGVILRNNEPANEIVSADLQSRKSETFSTRKQNLLLTSSGDEEKNRHSDTQLFKLSSNSKEIIDVKKVADSGNENGKPVSRKLHSKSFSLTENRIVASIGSNLFQQNRELWEKRAELQSQHSLATPRILTRNRIAPDLVMDLPFPATKDEPIHSSRESLSSNDFGESSSSGGSANMEDMTSAERFATQNQCTLKKNERYSDNSSGCFLDGTSSDSKKEVKLDFKHSNTSDKPKAEVKPQEPKKDYVNENSETINRLAIVDERLHIDEGIKNGTISDRSGTNVSTTIKEKSPIPQRNTKKYVSQFADLHLTGGCITAAVEAAATGSTTDKLGSFKPHVKVKPQVLRKPLILPPTTPEMTKRNKD